jgi:predicted acylesterase/phospholipase RssA
MTSAIEMRGSTFSGSEIPHLQQTRQLVEELKDELNFGKARKLLEEANSQYPQEVWIIQQLALCTYKDEELYPRHRLEMAIALLESIGLRDSATKDAETLALGGAIYKRMWEFGGQLEHLYESLAFYRAAYERNPQQDRGYGAINAAYLLDLLATRAEGVKKRSNLISKEAPILRNEAREIREDVLKTLLDQQKNPDLAGRYWFLVTLGEAYFGLGKYSEAAQYLDRASRVQDVKEWELQSTFRQWIGVARQQGIEVPAEHQPPEQWHEAWKTLQHLLGDDTAEALTCYRGKVGLALSGGGFRASLFHLGVLARLAEVDALRGVDVLSTVSGGSIVGAQYYLEVQNLLQDPSKKLTRDDYLDLVEKLQKDFLQGVQTNIRMRAFNDFFDNVKMLFSKSYSRSHKLGELYETHLYAKVADGKNGQLRFMSDLLVKPTHGKFQGDSFKPNFHNWRRRAKVPILLLNTTSLNSGHNWFFTASWMGEPPGLVSEEIDCNDRYRRLYYSQAPEHLNNFRLGHAAAASSCVPGLFEPLTLDKLYQDRTLKLVDGGVHDNQGVQGLLDEGCTLILCSDACGQMVNLENPAGDPRSVLSRTVSVLQDRVRETGYQDLQARLDSRALQGLFFIHTQKELASKPLDWLNCQDPSSNKANGNLTSYGIAKDLQHKIAALRTDLDSFTEVEACALMASGYLMAEQHLKDLDTQHRKDGKPGTWGDFEIDAEQQRDWDFLKLKTLLAEQPGDQASDKRKDLALQLEVGRCLFFKAWQLIPMLKLTAFAIAGLAALGLFILISSQWQNTLFSISVGGLTLALFGILTALFMPAMRWLNPKKEVDSIMIKTAIALTGYCMAKLHLNIFDPLFLARGKLERLLNLNDK